MNKEKYNSEKISEYLISIGVEFLMKQETDRIMKYINHARAGIVKEINIEIQKILKKNYKTENVFEPKEDPRENIARDLALDFLMPEEEFKKQFNLCDRDFDLVCDYFDVSKEAVEYRVLRLSI